MVGRVNDVYYSRGIWEVTTPVGSGEEVSIMGSERGEMKQTGYLIDRQDPILEI
jgi:hypothetical protein